jgi:hypothetical protein
MRRSTIVFILLFAVVLGAAYYFNSRSKAEVVETTPEPSAPIEYLVRPEDGLPTSIHIQSKAGEVVEVARNEENAWALTLPIEAFADQGMVEAAATQVATMRILERLPDLALDAVGLDHPDYIIKLGFTGGVERMIEIGVLTPTESGYYARGEDGEIVIVSKNAVDPLLGLLTSPPYAPTETPSPTAP